MLRYHLEQNEIYDKIVPEEAKLTGAKGEEFKKVLLELLPAMKSETLIIDLSNVETLDSVVVSAFIEARKQLKEDNLFITEVKPAIYKLLQAISLDKAVNISPQEVSAFKTEKISPTPVRELVEDWDDEEILLADYEETWEELEEIIKYLKEDAIEVEIEENKDLLEQIFEMEDDILEEF